ncbi:hypothetical protein BH18ACT1_BH18ACT1_14080 [soil metagenome]
MARAEAGFQQFVVGADAQRDLDGARRLRSLVS